MMGIRSEGDEGGGLVTRSRNQHQLTCMYVCTCIYVCKIYIHKFILNILYNMTLYEKTNSLIASHEVKTNCLAQYLLHCSMKCGVLVCVMVLWCCVVIW